MRTLPRALVAALLVSAAGWFPTLDARVDTADTRLLTQPAISASHMAFIYAGDLFVADLGATENPTNVRRLTTDDGVESNPVFSPDGRTIAFSAQYDGNTDVYTVPVAGGAPTRLTWHPAPTSSGLHAGRKAVLFTSQRATFTGRYTQLFTVPGPGRRSKKRCRSRTRRAATYSPDGQRIAYNPIAPRLPAVEAVSRRHGVAALALQHARDTRSRRSRSRRRASNDVEPMWIGETRLFPFGPQRRVQPVRLRHESQAGPPDDEPRGFPVLNASAGAGRIVYEQAGALHVLDPQTGSSRRLTIGVASDLRETRAAVRQRRAMDPRCGAVADRRARGVRVPRRDRDGARREGRRPQPDEQRGCARSLPGVVARRPLDRLVLRQAGEYQLYIGSAGRQGRAARHQGDRRRFLQRSGLVARLTEDRLLRQLASRSTGST